MKAIISLFAIALAVVSGFFFFEKDQKNDEFVLSVTSDNLDLGTVCVGRHTAVISITNHSNRDRKVLGVNRMCTRNCCFSPQTSDGLATIAPSQTYQLIIEIEVKGKGDFTAPVKFYVEDRNIRLIEMGFFGKGE